MAIKEGTWMRSSCFAKVATFLALPPSSMFFEKSFAYLSQLAQIAQIAQNPDVQA
jgi:hypothetical protein